MSSVCENSLRQQYGAPVVHEAAWSAVTSVSEGDGEAYGAALLTISRFHGRLSIIDALKDERTPGVALDALLSWYSQLDCHSGFAHSCRSIAAHPNVTADAENYCRQKKSAIVNEALASSPGVSGESVERMLRSKSRKVIGALLGNGSLSGDQLRRAERRARAIGISTWSIVLAGKRNVSMPVDVVLSWLSGDDERARFEALSSPVVPRSVLWEYMAAQEPFVGDADLWVPVFDWYSNADGDMIDWFLERHEEWLLGGGVWDVCYSVELSSVLSHPRARSEALGRLYARYGRKTRWLRDAVLESVSCPDWVRWDAAIVSDWSHTVNAARSVAAPSWFVRRLADAGELERAADCPNAPGDLLVEALGAEMARDEGIELKFGDSRERFKYDILLHQNMPPAIRREVAPWYPDALWLVARDGFMGRA